MQQLPPCFPPVSLVPWLIVYCPAKTDLLGRPLAAALEGHVCYGLCLFFHLEQNRLNEDRHGKQGRVHQSGVAPVKARA